MSRGRDAATAPAVRGARDSVATALALWFGCGLVPIAPGTAGTLGALPLWYLVRGGGPVVVSITAAVITGVGIWSAGVVARLRGSDDPQVVVIDEVAGVLVALAAAPSTFRGVAAAFLLFRLFDVTKPFPARAAERLHGGFGIVLDDVVAGIYAAVGVLLLRSLGWLA